MAYTKVFAIRARLDDRVKYAVNGEKTELDERIIYTADSEKTDTVRFVTTLNCRPAETAFAAMQKTKKKYKKICRVTVLAKKAAATPVPSATQTNAPAPAPTQSAASTPEPTKGVIFASSIKQALENNPLVTNSYTADPAVLEYNGRLYVYMTNDSQHYEKGEHKKSNTYGYIQSLHIISTCLLYTSPSPRDA